MRVTQTTLVLTPSNNSFQLVYLILHWTDLSPNCIVHYIHHHHHSAVAPIRYRTHVLPVCVPVRPGNLRWHTKEKRGNLEQMLHQHTIPRWWRDCGEICCTRRLPQRGKLPWDRQIPRLLCSRLQTYHHRYFLVPTKRPIGRRWQSGGWWRECHRLGQVSIQPKQTKD